MLNDHAKVAIIPDDIWCDKGEGKQKIRIEDLRRDGRVVITRIAGNAAHALNREMTVTREQLLMAFKPSC